MEQKKELQNYLLVYMTVNGKEHPCKEQLIKMIEKEIRKSQDCHFCGVPGQNLYYNIDHKNNRGLIICKVCNNHEEI